MLSYFRARLARKQVLQLYIELLLLLDANILFDNFLCLLDQPLLKSLNLVQQLPGVRVCALKLSPSMVVEWVFKFFGESFHLEALLLKCIRKTEDFFSKVINLGSFALFNSQLTL